MSNNLRENKKSQGQEDEKEQVFASLEESFLSEPGGRPSLDEALSGGSVGARAAGMGRVGDQCSSFS